MKKILCLIIYFSILFYPFIIFSQEKNEYQDAVNNNSEWIETYREYANSLVDYYEEISKYQNPYYTYNKSILDGVSFIGDRETNGKFTVWFIIQNNTKRVIYLNKMQYGVEKIDGTIYYLKKPKVVEQGGISDNYALDPAQKVIVFCVSPFKDLFEVRDIKEIGLKDQRGRRIFFVPKDKIRQYTKLPNPIIRHLRNFWWNITKWN